MNRRMEAALRAVDRLARHPAPGSLADGLSEPMARECLRIATGLVNAEALERALEVPGLPPASAAVVAARGVFTASLEWVVLLAAAGAEVLLKSPAAAPAFGAAVVEAFRAEGLPVSGTTARALPPVEALVAMGGDAAMSALAAAHPQARLLLHGHRFSVAVVGGASPGTSGPPTGVPAASGLALAAALARDAVLYDGRGCFTPAAIFVLGDPAAADQLADHLRDALVHLHEALPPGIAEPLHGPTWRRRAGLARVRGGLREGDRWAVAVLPPGDFEPAALHRFVPVHPVPRLEAVGAALAPWRRHLAACATDLPDPAPLVGMGFERVCRPGQLQAPPFGRPHGGREPLRPLMHHPSIEGFGRPAR